MRNGRGIGVRIRDVRVSCGDNGVALLELALLSVVLLPVLLMGLALVRYMELGRELSIALEYAIRAAEGGPWRIAPNSRGESVIQVDREAIDRAVEDSVRRVEQAIVRDSLSVNSGRYRVESAMVLVGVDRVTGRLDIERAEIRSRAVGGLPVKSRDLTATAPSALVAALARSSPAEGQSALSVRDNPGAAGYFGLVPVVVVRAFRSIGSEEMGFFLESMGLPSYVFAAEVGLVRVEAGV